MASKSRDICPTCNLPWPNFCPQDGTRLQGPWTCPNAVDPAPAAEDPPTVEAAPVAGKRDTERMEQPAPQDDLDKTVLETPAIRADAAHAWLEQRKKRAAQAPPAPDPAPQIKPKAAAAQAPPPGRTPPAPPPGRTPPAPTIASKKKKRKAKTRSPDDVATMIDMAALAATGPPPGSRRTSPPPPKEPAQKKLSGAQLAQLAESTKAEVKGTRREAAGATRFDGHALPADARAQAAALVKGTAKKAAATKASGKRGQPAEFSETQWFMKGVEVDADLLELVEEDEYIRDESISDDKRRKFTLREEDE